MQIEELICKTYYFYFWQKPNYSKINIDSCGKIADKSIKTIVFIFKYTIFKHKMHLNYGIFFKT